MCLSDGLSFGCCYCRLFIGVVGGFWLWRWGILICGFGISKKLVACYLFRLVCSWLNFCWNMLASLFEGLGCFYVSGNLFSFVFGSFAAVVICRLLAAILGLDLCFSSLFWEDLVGVILAESCSICPRAFVFRTQSRRL